MRDRRNPWIKAGVTMTALALLVAGVVLAQDPRPAQDPAANPSTKDAKDKGKSVKKGLVKSPARTPSKGLRKSVDPLANAANANGAAPANPNDPNAKAANGAGNRVLAPGTFHYRFKIALGEVPPLAVSYYPAKVTGFNTPVVMLIHERERSSKDFEESIAELKKYSLAEELQKQGFTVMALDLRGHGGSVPRRTLARADWPNVVEDLQVAYYCLVDRHNWGELNLARLGVVAMGEGANVATHWAARGGAVSSEGRTSDLGALVLLSPMIDAQSQGLNFKPAISAIAARVPLAILAGEKDVASFPLVDDGIASVKSIVRRTARNKVETFPSALHGYKLLQFEPNLTQNIFRFLETTSKVKSDPWEGRYLLTPVTYSDIQVIKNPERPDPNAATKKAAN